MVSEIVLLFMGIYDILRKARAKLDQRFLKMVGIWVWYRYQDILVHVLRVFFSSLCWIALKKVETHRSLVSRVQFA